MENLVEKYLGNSPGGFVGRDYKHGEYKSLILSAEKYLKKAEQKFDGKRYKVDDEFIIDILDLLDDLTTALKKYDKK